MPMISYVLARPGYFNNGGIARLWHDHFAEGLLFKSTYAKFLERVNQVIVVLKQNLMTING